MAKVSLRTYSQEIETMIETGQLDEAIAHCRHILNTYPKSLEIYRLLGKAFLEAKRFDEAINVFQRVVMAVPGDFVSHVGMSIINDEQNRLDDAIWHMERAFESQPSNAAIQSELQRLYGRRDGVEPPKIRLTRGALAYMYVQGELYPQAISEILSVLEEDPDRQNMQVLLARAYFHSGQKSEAAEICSRLLSQYPYNLDANRILVELLPESERAEDKYVYRHRINELDPYAAFATGSVFRTSEVPDGAVSLERLDWDGRQEELDSDLGTSYKINLEPDEIGVPNAVEQPDWLKVGHLEDEPSFGLPTDEPVPSSGSDSQIPDFLREAGWKEDSGTFEESVSHLDSSDAPEPEIEPADLPDWVKEMAPEAVDAGTLELSPIEQDGASGEDLAPDWLQDLGGEEQETSGEDTGARVGDALPDWLPQVEEGDFTPTAEEQPTEQPAEDPADLNELGVSPSEQDDAVAWLEGLAAKHGAKPEELVTDPSARTDVEPEWVTQARQAGEVDQSIKDEPLEKEPVPQVAPEGSSDLGAFSGEQDDALVRVEDLEIQDVEEPEILNNDLEALYDTSVEEVPVPDLGESEAPSVSAEIETLSAPPEPPIDLETLGTSTEEQEDAIAWLENLAEKHGAKPEELVSDSALRKETAPEWVQQASEAAAVSKALQDPVSEEVELTPMEETEASVSDVMQPSEDVDKPLSEELEESQAGEPIWPAPTSETEIEAKVIGNGGFDYRATPESEIDDWSEEPGVENEPAEPVAEDEAPDWLYEMEDTVSEQAPMSETVDKELPDWLAGMEETETPAEVVGQPAQTELLNTDAGDLPDWLAGLQDSNEPAVVTPSEDLPDWVGTEGPEVSEELEEPLVDKPVPTTPDEWHPVDKQESSLPEPQHDQPEPVTRSGTGMLERGTVSPATSPALNQARTELSRGNIPAALEEYGKLIKKGKYLDETIFDLREALYRYPVEVSIWQSLGDAFMRENRLQDALDAYTKAEELLR